MVCCAPCVFFARVSGPCSNCHVMHNSQNGDAVDPDGANQYLTIDGCVGCHSFKSSDTVRTLGSSSLPIVFNTSQPSSPLAGGNFYWMVNQSDHRFGNNVQSIAGADNNITYVPGKLYRQRLHAYYYGLLQLSLFWLSPGLSGYTFYDSKERECINLSGLPYPGHAPCG